MDKKGRISKSELISQCNKIIRFEPTKEDEEEIAREQKLMLDSLIPEERKD